MILGPPSLLPNKYRGLFLHCGKAAGVWMWQSPLLSISRKLELYLHSSIHLHSEVLNSLSMGRNLTFYSLMMIMITMKWKEFRRNPSWPNRNIAALSWKSWGKPRNTSLRTAGVPTEGRTESLQNMSLGPHRYATGLDADQWNHRTPYQ
jgi:hypothetical protein